MSRDRCVLNSLWKKRSVLVVVVMVKSLFTRGAHGNCFRFAHPAEAIRRLWHMLFCGLHTYMLPCGFQASSSLVPAEPDFEKALADEGKFLTEFVKARESVKRVYWQKKPASS